MQRENLGAVCRRGGPRRLLPCALGPFARMLVPKGNPMRLLPHSIFLVLLPLATAARAEEGPQPPTEQSLQGTLVAYAEIYLPSNVNSAPAAEAAAMQIALA